MPSIEAQCAIGQRYSRTVSGIDSRTAVELDQHSCHHQSSVVGRDAIASIALGPPATKLHRAVGIQPRPVGQELKVIQHHRYDVAAASREHSVARAALDCHVTQRVAVEARVPVLKPNPFHRIFHHTISHRHVTIQNTDAIPIPW